MASMRVVDLGKDVPYARGMEAMRDAIARVDVDGPALVLQEHAPTITTTRSGGLAFVHATDDVLAAAGITRVETDRGGDVTFHGPGQLTGYPVLRLANAGEPADLHGYVHALEAALVRACIRLGVPDAHAVAGRTGVWCDAPVVDDETLGCNFHVTARQECKLVALGVGVGAGVTRHGFALNITTDLERYTRHITPCGLVGRHVTSLERVMLRVPSPEVVRETVVEEVLRALGPLHRAR